MHGRLRALAVLAVILASSQANAQQATETTTYSYDALGRLVGSGYEGGPNNGTKVAIQYDAAGNRKTYTVTGAVDARSSARFVIVPLNGFTLIPINP